MILLVILLVASVSSIDVEVTIECPTCLFINKTCYNATHLLDLDAPFRNKIVITKMGILRSKNILFYSFEPKIDDLEYYKTGFVNLDAPESSGIINNGTNIRMNFGTFDIDQDNSLVYLGGSNGIFMLDMDSNNMIPYSSSGDTIDSIFYKNYVHFVKQRYTGVTVKHGDYFKFLLEKVPVQKFVITKSNVVIFINSFGLYVGKGDIPYRISPNPFFRGLTVDLDGEVYTWWVDGIYKVIVHRILQESEVVKIVDLSPIGAITFDNDNRLLFTMQKAVYRLIETSYNCSLATRYRYWLSD